jgi:LPXTG-site transpeptidase (sortase) family protein
MKIQWLSKVFSAILIMMLAVAVLPITPAYAANTVATPPTQNSNSTLAGTASAYTSDNVYASANVGGQNARYFGYGFTIPASSIIDGIVVSLEGNRTGGRDFDVDLTWNNATFENAITQPTSFGAADSTVLVGSSSSLAVWGAHVWTPAEVNSNNFRVRVTASGGGGTINLDQLLVIVYYHAPATFTITSSAGTGGTISPLGAVSVTEATNQTFTIPPSAGYIVSGVSIDGGTSVGAFNSYTFTNVIANHTIAASFDGGWQAPSGNVNGGGGDNVTTPGNAYVSDNTYVVANGGGQNARYFGFGLAIPAGDTIDGIQVSLEGNRTGGRDFDVDLTWNNGTFQNAITQPTSFGAADSTVLVGSSSSTAVWGAHVWTPAEVNSNNFRVRVTASGGGGTINLDQLQVKVYHHTPAPRTITATAGAGGSIAPSGAVVVADNASQTFTSTPNTSYIVQDVLVDGVSQGRANSYTFTNVIANHTIAASFDGGWQAPSGNVNGGGGDNVTTPGNAYVSDNTYVVANGGGQNARYFGFGLAIPAGDTIDGIQVSLEGNRTGGRDFDVDLTWNNGTFQNAITQPTSFGAADSTVLVGSSSSTAVWGAHVWTPAEVNSNNFRVRVTASGGGGTINLDQLQVKVYHHTPAPRTITATAGAGGSIAPSGAVVVADNASQTFTSTPNTSYIVQDVLVDGVSQGRANSYTFTNVIANHTIAASFDGGWQAPSGNVNGGGGDNVTTPGNAYVSDNTYVVANGGGQNARYFGFGLAVPASATITGIQVSLEGNRTAGRNFDVDLTWDNTTFQNAITQPTSFGAADSTVLVGSSSSTAVWGAHVWTPTEVNSNNFRVRVTASGGGGTINLDQLQVKVFYTLPATTTTVDCVSNPVVVFSNTTCTATVTRGSSTNTPSGTVTFSSGGTGGFTPAITCGLTPTATPGVASCSVTYTPGAVGTGSHLITASYGGDTNFGGSSGATTLTVNKATPAITFGAAPTPTYLGGNFTVSASTTNTDSSTLTYSWVSGPCALVSGGTFSSSGAGTCVVQANGAATANFDTASQTQSITIGKANQTINFTSTAPAGATYAGTTYTPIAASTSGLPVAITVDATASTVCSISGGGVVSFIGVGSCILNANQAGDVNYNPALQVQQSFVVAKANQTITFVAPVSPAAYNSTFSVSPTSDSGLTVTVTPTGVCSILGNTVTMTSGTGTCTLTASQAGDANYNAATDVVRTVTAEKIDQIITFAAPVSPAAYNSTFSVSPTSDSGLTVTVTPTGVCSILGSTVTMTSGTGTCTLTASQAGDTNYNPATDVVWTVTAQKIDQTITFAAPVSPAAYNSTFSVSPTSDSGLTVTVTSTGVCSILGSTVTMTSGTGTCTLTASQAGDANYNAATDVVQTVTAQKIDQTITFAAPVSPAAYNSTFSVSPTSDSGLIVTVTPTGVCSILGSTVTMTSGAGTCTLTASQAGDANYNAATDVVRTVTAQKIDQTITFAVPVSPAAYNSTFSISPTSDSGLTVTVTPTGICSILGSTVTMTSGTGTCTLTASQAGDSNYNPATDVVRTITAQKIDQTITFVAPVSPAAYNSTFSVSPTSDSGLAVTVTSTGVCSILGSTVTMTSGTGTCTLTASQAGDANYNAAADVVRTVSAQRANQIITFVAPVSPAAYNSTFSVSPTSDSGLAVTVTPTGVCSILGSTVTMTSGAGTCTLTASQAGDANYNAAADVVRTVSAQRANQIITFAAPVSPAAYNSTFSVSPTSDSGLTVTVTPTGVCSILGNTVTMTSGTGTCTLTASQAGDANYNAATNVVRTVSAQVMNQTITFVAPVSPAAYNSTFSVSPTSDSGLTVTVTATGVCSILGSTVTMTSGTGICTLTASQAGDANYNAATNVVQTVTAEKIDQTINVTTSAPTLAASGANFTVAATGGASGNPVTYSATGSCINLLAAFTTTTSGTCTVHYNQAGDANYNAATEVTQNTVVDGDAPTVTIEQGALPQVDPTNVSPIVFDVVFSESVADFDSGDVTISGMAGVPGITVSAGPGTNYTVSVTGMASGETVTATIAAGGAHDSVGNGNVDSTSVDNQVSYDTSLPSLTIASTATNPTRISPIPVTITFIEDVTGFDISDIVIGNGVASNFVAVAPGATTYTVDVTPTADGPVTVDVAAGAAQDATGNDNLAATRFTITYDTIPPQVMNVNIEDAGDGVLANLEVITTNITQLAAKFTEAVYNPVGDGDAKDVTNPANYMLIRDLGDTAGFQTASCRAGAVVPADTKIDITGVTYDSTTHVATFTVNGGLPLSNGNYRLFACGTTSITDLAGIELNNIGRGGQDFTIDFIIQISGGGGNVGNSGEGDGKSKKNSAGFSISGLLIPVTGFAPDQITALPAQPADKAYKPLNEMRIEIPTLGINFPIVGVAATEKGWDLTWLKDSVAYLEGSAYPTWSGNTVLTAHVTDAYNNLGPFSDIKGMQAGQKIYIHFNGQVFVYQVQENKKILPSDTATVFKHEEYDWITLVTCEDYNAKTKSYKYRRMVRAVLISVVPEKK